MSRQNGERTRPGGLWLLLVPAACCGGPLLVGDLAAAVLRLLSAGEPVSIPAAAAAARIPGPRAEAALRSWPAVFWDGHDQITGFWGLALAEMPHQARHAGRDLYAWCA